MRRILIVLALPTLHAAATFDRLSPTCVSEFHTLNDCLDDHGECSACTVIGPITTNWSNGLCDAVNDSICEAFGCCPACDAQFATYETCVAELVGRVTFQSCEIECERAPTSSPTTIAAVQEMFDEELDSQGCLDKFVAFANCTDKHSGLCDSCFVSPVPYNPRESGFCIAASAAICGFGTCCEPCQAEYVEFGACFDVIAEEVTFGSCVIDCDASGPTEQLNGGCIDRLQNYTQCVLQNPEECATCAILNLPQDPRETGFCEVATESICGFSKCCSSCDVAFQDFDECFEEWVATATFGKCLMDCDTFEGSDSNVSPSGCVDSLQAYSNCILDNPMTCGTQCIIQNLPQPTEDGFCQAAADSICGFQDCCGACDAEFDTLDKCVTTLASIVTLGECEIDCSALSAQEFFGYRHRGLRHG